MNIDPIIKSSPERKLVGKRFHTSVAKNNTHELWQSFMPRLGEITNRTSGDLFSLQVYNNFLKLDDISVDTIHEKWAAAEVTDFHSIPDGMEPITIPQGLHLTFIYKGLPSGFAETFFYIHSVWFPASKYTLDNRIHFEILGPKFNRLSPDSEEEIWIPVKLK